jgi:hypothetical protein
VHIQNVIKMGYVTMEKMKLLPSHIGLVLIKSYEGIGLEAVYSWQARKNFE